MKQLEIFFIDLYKQYNNLKSDAEKIEIIVANGYIRDKQNPNINHPILTKRLSMKFNASENIIYIMDTNAKPEIYTELFQVMNDINLEMLSTINEDLSQSEYHPLDRNDTIDFLKILAHKISSESLFIEKDDSNLFDNNSRIFMINDPVFIIRNRLDGTVHAMEQIIENIKKTEYVPNHLLDIVDGGLIETSVDNDESIDELLAQASGESIDFLLTKEANKEQLEIAKRIEMYNAVLVQGPPGTGKTHTIANLVGNFLANGKSVLVTSYTKKALTVLKEKLPKDIQNLCVSVLDESNDDMVKSIDGITEYMSKFTSFELKKQKEELKLSRLNVIDELSRTRKKIYNLLNSEYKSIVLNGDEYSPSEAAMYIAKNRCKLNFISGNVIPYSPFPLNIDELTRLYASNNKVDKIEEKELNYNLPNPDKLIKPQDLSKYVDSFESMKKGINEIELEKKWTININNDVYFDTEFGKFYIPDLNKDNLDELEKYISEYSEITNWEKIVCADGKKGIGYQNQWSSFINKINEVASFNEKILSDFFGKYLTIPIEDLLNYKSEIEKLRINLSKGKKFNKFNLMINNDLNKILNLKIINNNNIQSEDDCRFILNKIELYSLRNDLGLIWDELLGKKGVSKFFDLDIEEPEKIAQKYVDRITKYLNWYENDYPRLINLLKKCNIPTEIVFNIDSLDSDLDCIDKIFNSIINVLPYVVQTCKAKIEINEVNEKINHLVDFLDDNLLINSSICIDIKTALINKQKEEYYNCYCKLENIYNKYESLNDRNLLLNKIELVAPGWANDIRLRRDIHGESSYPIDIKEAWKYKQFEQILNDLTKDSLEDLQNKNSKLNLEYRKITEKYAVKSAWYELLSKTESDITMKQALKGWEITVKKIGKGTGKNAPKYKAEARKLMAKCQNAVPCWIMPINKALESLKPGENNFDVIIIDEASQSDITALAMAYFGKKMIIVGDDRQVSPLAIGTDIGKINALEHMYIKNKIPNSHLYSSKTSLYDIAATTFHPLMLREHFRCVPEIIGFSNMLSYDYKIKPLRDSDDSKILPAIINYRVDGQRVDKTNKVEAETIIALIKSCMSMKEYDGKTFGIISLKGDEQVKLIQELLFEYIDPIDIENRKILYGNASNFQGDERDIIFLSMIDSNEEGTGPLSLMSEGSDDSTKKRYNVAVSRAKDQLWVVNSLDSSSDLKLNDMRKKLLDYSSDPLAFAVKQDEIKKKSESIFEEEVANALVSRGYDIIQQYPVGNYRLDIVLKNKNNKVVIECDGEQFHSGEEKVREDMQRQTILERIGWKFIRIRGSKYFRNSEQEIDRVIEQLSNFDIYPSESKISNVERSSDLLDRIKIETYKNLNKMREDRLDSFLENPSIEKNMKDENIEILDMF